MTNDMTTAEDSGAAANKIPTRTVERRRTTSGYSQHLRKEEQMEASNVKAMRDALLTILGTVDHLQTRFAIPKLASEEILELKKIAEAAISATPRNCDIGTVEEQAERFHAFCESNKKCGDVYSCERCQLNSIEDCELAWAQMPYEEGGAK